MANEPVSVEETFDEKSNAVAVTAGMTEVILSLVFQLVLTIHLLDEVLHTNPSLDHMVHFASGTHLHDHDNDASVFDRLRIDNVRRRMVVDYGISLL